MAPYVLGAGCHEADPATSAFVEAVIVDPATGAVGVYHPLVIDEGTQPGGPVVPVVVAPGSVVGVWFGFDGDTLMLTGPGAGGCVNGLGDSAFGQFGYCNAPAFFAAAGNVAVPPLGTGRDGWPCPTVRSFRVVDQDQSDNVATVYYRTAAGGISQTGPGVRIVNPSDNGLLARAIDPALGCVPFTAPDLTNPGARTPALALNELSARRQGQPVALVPSNDPMTQVDGERSRAKTNSYRAGVGQPGLPAGGSTLRYCVDLARIGSAGLVRDRFLFAAAPSPVAGSANLGEFLRTRLTASIMLLNCAGSAPGGHRSDSEHDRGGER